MFVTRNYSMELRKSGKGKENARATVISIPPDVKVEDMRMCTERC
jgi:hypothetical protein